MHEPISILALPGDGIGPEIVEAALTCLNAVSQRFELRTQVTHAAIGGAAIDEFGESLPADTLEQARNADAILLGAVGDPRFDGLEPHARPEAALLGLRRALDLFANLRPLRTDLAPERSPLRADMASDVDVLFVRELTSGLYFGEPRGRDRRAGQRVAFDTMQYTEREVRRVAELAFELARARRGRVCSVDKANVLSCSSLWREVVSETANDYPDVELEHRLVDAFAMQLISQARSFDVVLTSNLFGDILTDEAAALAGSLGLMASASFGTREVARARRGLYEPIHGSAPDLAGRDVANPVGTLLALVMLLRETVGSAPARALDNAVRQTMADGVRTVDVSESAASAVGTKRFAEEVVRRLD